MRARPPGEPNAPCCHVALRDAGASTEELDGAVTAAVRTVDGVAGELSPDKDDLCVSYREGRFWQPDVTVATVVVRDGRLLMVEEQANGRLVLNQPAGHLEPDETLVDAATRETREETGWDVRLTAFVGAYQWKAPSSGSNAGRHYLRFVFAAEPVSHDPARPLDTGIVRALWMTPAELDAARERHRSPLVWQAVADHLAGRRHPLTLLQQLA
jgi:8-oxo-dGTP pyrophosphatase MutT (NUDIX family)